MSLTGKTILLTRQREQAGDLRRDIERRGARALLFPTIMVVSPHSWSDCDRALMILHEYDGLVFTSPNAVRGFLDRAGERGIAPDVVAGLSVWAVGEKTAEELHRHSVAVESLPERYEGAALAAHIRTEARPHARLLLPQGDLASDELVDRLRSFGFRADPVVVYRTIAPSVRDAEEIRSQLSGGLIDVVTFFSPSAARNFAALFKGEPLSAVLSQTVVAVIGPTTRNALRVLGVEPAVVADVSTASGVVDAIELYFAGSS